jgi:hypothetical protein
MCLLELYFSFKKLFICYEISGLKTYNGICILLQHQDNYGQLLTQALHTYGILCLGVFRLIDPSEKNVRRRRRFVITNPAGNFKLLLSDLVRELTCRDTALTT